MTPLRPCIILFGSRVRRDGRAGRGLRQRIGAALAAWGERRDARLILSGGSIGGRRAEALVMEEALLAAGVPRAALIVEPRSQDTLQSAIASAALLRGLPDLGEVFVCTSDFHLPRCRLLMALQGIRTRSIAAGSGRPRLLDAYFLYHAAREGLALPYDAGLMLWHRLRHGPPRGRG